MIAMNRSLEKKSAIRLSVVWPLVFALGAANSPPTHAEEEALLTPQGNPLKLIVREPTALFQEPDAASPGEPVQTFDPFYVLPTSQTGREKTQSGFYRVATAKSVSRAAGWIPADKVVEWEHVETTGFSYYGQREPVLFFATQEDAVAYYRGDPGAAEKAISREPARKVGSLFPLLGTEIVELPSGKKVEVYKLAYIAKRSAASTRSPSPGTNESPGAAPRTPRELQRDFVIQIVFVVDATASMQPWMNAMKEVMDDAVTQLAANPALKGRIEFGLVLYRDAVADPQKQKELEFITKVVSNLTPDFASFQQDLATIREAVVDSDDWPEYGLAGLYDAIKMKGWKKGGSKHIIWFSDAPTKVVSQDYKNAGKLTIPGVLSLAQPETPEGPFDCIQIHGLRIISEMAELTAEHFETLTKGRKVPGLHYSYAKQGDEAQFIADLTAALAQLANAARGVAEGNSDQVVDAVHATPPDSNQRRLLGGVLEMIKMTSESSTTETFQEGYATTLDREGNRCLEPFVLVDQVQLRLFNSALAHCVVSLESAGDPGSRNVQRIVENLKILGAGIPLAGEIEADTPLAEVLTRILGVPIRSPIFKLTPRMLASMTGKDFNDWKSQIEASQSIVKSHIDRTSIWFKLGRSGKSSELHAFFKVSDLP